MMRIVIRKGSQITRSLPLRPGTRLSLGRQPEGNDIVLPDPKASRRHGCLEFDGTTLLFTDRGSGNGTRLRGTLLLPEVPAEIPVGTPVEIGEYTLTMEESTGDDPSPETDDTTTLPVQRVPMGQVAVLHGLGGLLRGQVFSLGTDEVVLGRLPECHIQVVDGLVSRRNARITHADGIHFIEDLGSSNGTFVNKERVNQPRPLRPGDEIRVGEQLFTFRHIPEADAPPPAKPGHTDTVITEPLPPRTASQPTDAHLPQGKRGTRTIPMLLLLALIGYLVWRGGDSGHEPGSDKPQADATRPVTLIQPVRLDIPVTLEMTGNLHPAHATTILLPLGQRVQTLWAEDQQTLAEGDRILAMEMPESLRAARTQATAAVQSAKAEIARSEAEVGKADGALELARKNLAIAVENVERNAPLYEGGHLLQQEWNRIRNAHNNAVTEVTIREMERRQAQSMVEQTQAQAQQAQADLEDVLARVADLEVTAKSAGVLDGLKVESGDTITPETRVLRVLEYESAIKVIVPVPEDDIALIRRGMPAEVWLSRAPERVVRGEVTSIPATATHRRYDVEIRVPNKDAHLRPGAQAMVRFHIETREQALALPTSVLSQDPLGRPRVFVFDPETSTARAVPVHRGAEFLHAGRRMVEILPVLGAWRILEPEDRIVFDGHRNLQDGGVVDVRGDVPTETP